MVDNHEKAINLLSQDDKPLLRYVCWKDGEWWLGYLEDYSDYWTQGRTRKELEENLIDILNGVTS